METRVTSRDHMNVYPPINNQSFVSSNLHHDIFVLVVIDIYFVKPYEQQVIFLFENFHADLAVYKN